MNYERLHKEFSLIYNNKTKQSMLHLTESAMILASIKKRHEQVFALLQNIDTALCS